MNINGSVSNLFEEETCPSNSPNGVLRFLGQHGVCNLAYDGDVGQNPGYIFRGELDYSTPLWSSLEREWFDQKHVKETGCAADLLSFEKQLLDNFMRDASVTSNIAMKHGNPISTQPETDIFWWMSFMQHYRTKTRFLDFTRDIRFALFFALKQYCQKKNAKYRDKGILIYCFPCKNLRHQNDDDINKCPFRHKDGSINMSDALGHQMKFGWAEPHFKTFEERYSRDKREQSFGWDQPYYLNPRLSFQKGMLVYPYETENVQIEKSKSWLIKCLHLNSGDHFHIGSAKSVVPPVKIRITNGSISPLLEYVQDTFKLTPATVYLDYGKIGDRLHEDGEE